MILLGESYRSHRPTFIGLLATLCMLWVSLAASAQGYVQFNYDSLVRVPGQNAFWEDANLVIPWGIAFFPKGPIWISNAGSGTSTLYNGKNLGFPFPTIKNPLVVTVPARVATHAGTPGSPTGIVSNGTADFVVSQNGTSGPALFIFATRDGTISGWSPTVNFSSAITMVDNSASGDSYRGLALGSNSSGNFLYAVNTAGGDIDVFDTHFAHAELAGSFTDPGLPPGFRPFNIQNFGQLTHEVDPQWWGPGFRPFFTATFPNVLVVTYTSFHSDGLVDAFDTDGNFLGPLAADGTLNEPWGLARAPANFGQFSNAALVGNHGDGRINAFDPNTGNFLGQLSDRNGNPIEIKGLWGLAFGNDGLAGRANYLLFTAGSKGGLFGSLHALGQ